MKWTECPVGRAQHPVECISHGYQKDMGGMIAHLNDHHLWTRQQIADWLEPIELAHIKPAEEPIAQETEVPILVS